MDIQSFLESGLLESYALGQCTATERTLVEDMLAQHAEARSELSAIESALEQYANAQAIAPPSERTIKLDGERVQRKVDVRLYAYDGSIQIAAARLYQGQTTNFRTPGGGFAPVFFV